MRKPDLPAVGKKVSSLDPDRVLAVVFPILLVASVFALAVMAGFLGCTLGEAAPVMALPLAAAGVISYAAGRHWLLLTLSVVPSAAAFLFSAEAGTIVVILLLCTRGVACMSALVQRRAVLSLVRAVEVSGVRGKRILTDRLVLFLFGIPSSIDTRTISVASGVARKGMPWAEMLGTLEIALVPCLMLWTAAFVTMDLPNTFYGIDVYMTLAVASLYIAAVSLPWAALRSIDVRVGTEGGGMSLHDGLISTASRMAAALIPMLLVTAAFLYDAGDIDYVLASGAMTAAAALISSAMYHLEFEHAAVGDMVSRCSVYVRDGSRRGGLRLRSTGC